MTIITTRISVLPDGTVSLAQPLPVGEYLARVELANVLVARPPLEPFDITRLPVFDLGPWPEGLGLRREDMYGDDGR